MRFTRQRTTLLASLLLLPVVLTACDDPLPTGADDHEDATADLQVDLTLSPDHVHIYSDVTFTVAVTDHHGDPVTDFDQIHIEYREASDTEWSEIELTQDGDTFTGNHSFSSSGDYDVRVMGQRPEDASPVMMHEMSDHLHAARAHQTTGGYSVEFEAFPGHIHDGDTGTMRFWVIDESDGSDDPVTGLGPEIHVTESDASEFTHSATEADPGVYEADHTFQSAEDATVALHFTGSGGGSAEAEFTIHIAHAHD